MVDERRRSGTGRQAARILSGRRRPL